MIQSTNRVFYTKGETYHIDRDLVDISGDKSIDEKYKIYNDFFKWIPFNYMYLHKKECDY